MEKLIVRLELIGKIKVGDKLHIDENAEYSIDHNYWYSSVSRWYYNNNRKLATEKIEELLVSVIELINQDMPDYNKRRLIRSIHNSINGLRALIVTYQSDLSVVSNLENIIERLQLLVD